MFTHGVHRQELLAYFEFSGETSVSRRLGSNSSHAVVRVVLEARRQAHSDWALRNLSDMCPGPSITHASGWVAAGGPLVSTGWRSSLSIMC